jgi:hypothetical protein
MDRLVAGESHFRDDFGQSAQFRSREIRPTREGPAQGLVSRRGYSIRRAAADHRLDELLHRGSSRPIFNGAESRAQSLAHRPKIATEPEIQSKLHVAKVYEHGHPSRLPKNIPLGPPFGSADAVP